MMGWIDNNTVLTSAIVRLEPLQQEHFPRLIEIAKDKRIWEFYLYDGSQRESIHRVLQAMLAEMQTGVRLPFVIVLNQTNEIIGSTSLMDIQPSHKKLEIGTTWLIPNYWATAVNPACKLLLLSFCFETLGCVRVQFKTDENNLRSQKAIQKIGGVFEGILRNDMLRENNTRRHSACFSIIEEDWPQTKKHLNTFLSARLESDRNSSLLPAPSV